MDEDKFQELHISLGHRDLTTVDPSVVPLQAFHRVVELNLANNSIRDLTFLKSYCSLRTLILDGNELSHTTRFPPLQSLTTLTLNKNKIASVPMLLNSLSLSFPNLTFLSLLANDGVPSYLNNHTAVEYADYRQLVIARLPKLQFLDDTPVTDEERAASAEHFGEPKEPKSPNRSPRGSFIRRTESGKRTSRTSISKRESALL